MRGRARAVVRFEANDGLRARFQCKHRRPGAAVKLHTRVDPRGVIPMTTRVNSPGAQPRAARDRGFDLALRRARLVGCSAVTARRMNLSGCSKLATDMSWSTASQ